MLLTARHANYLDLEPTATRHTYAAIRAKLVDMDNMFGTKATVSTAAYGHGTQRAENTQRTDKEIRCWDCNEVGVKRGHDGCKNP